LDRKAGLGKELKRVLCTKTILALAAKESIHRWPFWRRTQNGNVLKEQEIGGGSQMLEGLILKRTFPLKTTCGKPLLQGGKGNL